MKCNRNDLSSINILQVPDRETMALQDIEKTISGTFN